MTDAPTILKGSCACGAVSYTSTTLPSSISICHCSTCRKLSGAPSLPWALYPDTSLIWYSNNKPIGSTPTKRAFRATPLSTPSSIRVSAISPIAIRGSCASCGSHLFKKYHFDGEFSSVALGSLDEKSMKESGKELPGVKEHVFLGEKMGWNEFVGVENFVGMKEELVMKMKGWREERERELEIRIGV